MDGPRQHLQDYSTGGIQHKDGPAERCTIKTPPVGAGGVAISCSRGQVRAICNYLPMCMGMTTHVNSSGPTPTGRRTPGALDRVVSRAICGSSTTLSTSIM